MTRALVALAALVTLAAGCASPELVRPAPPLDQARRVAVAFQASEQVSALEDLLSSHNHAAPAPKSVHEFFQARLLNTVNKQREDFRAEAAEAGLTVAPDLPVLELIPAGPKAGAAHPVDGRTPLPEPLRVALKGSTGAELALLGRLLVYADNWREYVSRTRTGGIIVREYHMRTGIVVEYSLYDLTTGKAVGGRRLVGNNRLTSERRAEIDLAAIAEDESSVRITAELADRMAELFLTRVD